MTFDIHFDRFVVLTTLGQQCHQKNTVMNSKSALSLLCLAIILIVSYVGYFAPHVVAIHVGFLLMATLGYSLRLALPLWFLAFMFSDLVVPPSARLEENLTGKIAVITGGSQGSGRGFAFGLSESGATVYITGRTLSSLKETCALAPGPGICIPSVVDSADDKALETFFAKVANETGGRLDILVNNAYAGVGWWGKRKILGKPFWEQGMGLYDAVTTVGVRSHYKVYDEKS